VASKTVSEISRLSANLTAFDLPVHEGGQMTTPHEPVYTPERPNEKRAESAPPQSRTARAARPRAKPAVKRQAPASETSLSMLIRAASAVDGPAPEAGAFWIHDDTAPEAAPGPVGGRIKRILDVAIAGTTLVLLSPLLVMVALLIYMRMGRPILFPQQRIGFEGRPFACFKFRTMVNDAEAALQSYLAENPQAAREWSLRQKLEHDPRVTMLGRLLRRSSIDELPQLFNVLSGHMSCVGPRPVVSDELARYGKHRKDYVKARPGLTGAWQVSGRNRLSYRRRVALDSHYVRKWSIWRDLWILIMTIPAVLRSDTT
jgi:exopolysaccharide production protein ExoY